MKCPYCGRDSGELPVEAIRASMKGPKMIEIFDLIVERGQLGVGLEELVDKIYPGSNRHTHHNSLKVTMIRLKERVRQFGWDIESGVANNSSTDRVYRIKPLEKTNAA